MQSSVVAVDTVILEPRDRRLLLVVVSNAIDLKVLAHVSFYARGSDADMSRRTSSKRSERTWDLSTTTRA